DLRDLNVAAPRNFKVMPYALASANRNFTPGAKTDGDANWGVDAKIGVTEPEPRSDLQHRLRAGRSRRAAGEPDAVQPALPRRSRPFFLENRALFVGKNGEIDLFFSRRIGITDNGTLVPIRGGARLSGQGRRTERRRARHADRRRRQCRREQLRRGPCRQGSSQSIERGRHLREPRGDRRFRRQGRLEPNVGRRRQVGHCRDLDLDRLRGAHRNARRRRA
ncbi:MAG: hypothetical protein QM736_29610, partial [Vicinamibacterales bacterium]